jgi:hypothetical protein
MTLEEELNRGLHDLARGAGSAEGLGPDIRRAASRRRTHLVQARAALAVVGAGMLIAGFVAFALARQYGKRVGFRVMISNPDIPGYALPEFIREKVPFVRLGAWQKREREEPRCDDPFFQSAYAELIDLLADVYDGHPDVEYVDTSMYGFWGEGHTWPLEKIPYPDYITAENTFVRMFQKQAARWRKTPLATNTQPDFSKVGNSELVDRTIRSFNWLRTDTIFIENEQIEALSTIFPLKVSSRFPGSIGGGSRGADRMRTRVAGRIIHRIFMNGTAYFARLLCYRFSSHEFDNIQPQEVRENVASNLPREMPDGIRTR